MNKFKEILNKKYMRYALFAVGGLVSGMLIFGLSGDESTHKHDELVETEPGIWTCSMHPQIKMDKPGKCPLCAMDLIPLRKNSAHAASEMIDPNAIQLSDEAVALANIQTSVVSRGSNAKEVRLYGKIVPDERTIQSQTAHVSGRIEELKVDFTGQSVRKGETIARIYSPDLMNAQQELLVALQTEQSRLIEATREKLRNWKMTDDQIAEIEKSGKVSASIAVKATTGGIVSARNVNVGDYISAGDILFNISDLYRVWAVFDAYETDLPYLRVGETIDFTLQALPGKTFAGKISFVDPVLDPTTRTARIRVDMSNPDLLLKPEMYALATVNAQLNTNSNELIIPESAVLWTGKRSVVYVKQPNVETPAYRLREVTLGEKLSQAYVVTNGLQEGEQIVTNGTFTLDASAQLEGKSSMMNDDVTTSATHQNMSHHENKMGDADHSAMKMEMLAVSGSCGMCKERIEKTALSVVGVKEASWDAGSQQLHLRFDPAKAELKQIGRLLAAEGHDNGLEKAADSVYNELPSCCLYR